MSNGQVNDRPAFAFEPPPGGGVSLRSSDGSVFCVHSVILGLVSSVFADMFSIGRASEEEIRLDDDSESISLMLAFVYPSSMTPTIDRIDLLEKCLKISQKYNVQKIIQTLDRDLSRSEPQTRLIRSGDPLRIFRLAMTYGLPSCRVLAAKAVMPRHVNLQEPEGIVKVAQEHPASAHVIGMVGAQLLRSKIVADIVFEFEEGFLPETYVKAKYGQESDFINSEGGGLMMCDGCAAQLEDLWNIEERPLAYAPNWIYGWARYAYAELGCKPLDECKELFNPASFVFWCKDYIDVCEDCVDATIEARDYSSGPPGQVFANWASQVRRLFEKELGALDCLYSL
ncbi:hypothetical protein FRC07_006001 [Ceratobasidium sp. 392]|nr:hypothetical protein FRC07_006001 [Ceratobasidium sp. 392]